jgi:hypothetical protein
MELGLLPKYKCHREVYAFKVFKVALSPQETVNMSVTDFDIATLSAEDKSIRKVSVARAFILKHAYDGSGIDLGLIIGNYYVMDEHFGEYMMLSSEFEKEHSLIKNNLITKFLSWTRNLSKALRSTLTNR